MKLNEAWLRTFSNPKISTDVLVEQLTMAGLEVDGVEPAAAAFSGVVVGEVNSVESHPNADKLRLCKVNVGQSEALSIVCGAANVRPNLKVPVATIGAKLPGDFVIKKSKLRGEASFGMLCSESELGLAETVDGLMELPADAPIGKDIREYLELEDHIIDIDLTPNRADCLSAEGVGREIALLNNAVFSRVDFSSAQESHSDVARIELQAPEACPRYLGRLLTGLNAQAETPLWMLERLRRAGHRGLGPLVDVTNYVLLELGQPLHAFDQSKLQGDVQVRFALGDERVGLLNEQTVELNENTLVIADDRGPIALAGIMGGSETAVDENTTEVFLECAFFAPAAIMGKARQYGLHTDSSHRFERGVDPELQSRAIQRATQLILDICGGQAGPITEVVESSQLPQRKAIHLRSLRIERLLGIQFEAVRVREIFECLEMEVADAPDGWMITPPSFRFDIAIEADLIEELARVYGYDRLPQHSLHLPSIVRPDQEHYLGLDRLKDILVERGYQEAICYSFVDENIQSQIIPEWQSYPLKNPISSDMAVMRTSLWTGLLEAAKKNINRNQSSIRFFESGLRFVKTDSVLQQEAMLAGIVTGSVTEEQWSLPCRDADFYDLKGDVEALIAATGNQQDYEFNAGNHPALHPGQCAEIRTKNQSSVGFMGLLHPALEKSLGFSQKIYLFEFKQEALAARRIPKFAELSKFPSIRRDIAIIVDEALEVQLLVDYIMDQGRLIQDVVVFDLYQGKGVETTSKSVALGLIFQDFSKTLVDQEVEDIVHGLIEGMSQTFNARLRD